MPLDLQQLAQYPLFAGIREMDLPAMLSCMGSFQKSYRKDEVILLESNEVRNVGVILSGVVHMVKEDIEGRPDASGRHEKRRTVRRILFLRQPSQCPGELSRRRALRGSVSAVL